VRTGSALEEFVAPSHLGVHSVLDLDPVGAGASAWSRPLASLPTVPLGFVRSRATQLKFDRYQWLVSQFGSDFFVGVEDRAGLPEG
jgi:hypothetical protein